MRLINTSTLELETFNDITTRPRYAILSHTWTENEIAFEDYHPSEVSSDVAGYKKIRRACRHARSENHDNIWIDTCCIDKRSSAELSEAINSMWRWYEESTVCFAYLADVPYSRAYLDLRHDGQWKNSFVYKEFLESQWFTRGWTLQELLAPESVHFLSADWKHIGSKRTLRKPVAFACGMDAVYLINRAASECSTYVKMSFAARRQTTREEDMAYCLLGLFGINMPLLYGEGRAQACKRLQLAIVEAEHDPSLLAWSHDKSTEFELWLGFFPCFATSASHFPSEHYVEALDEEDRRQFSLAIIRPYSVKNIGLHITLPVVSIPEEKRYAERIWEDGLGFYAIVGKVENFGHPEYTAIPIHSSSGHPNASQNTEMIEDAVYIRSRPGIVLLPDKDLARSKERCFYIGNPPKYQEKHRTKMGIDGRQRRRSAKPT